MSARFLVGDVFDRMAELEGPYELVITSPPFLALRSYLPDGHPDKAKEIGSEATPAAFLDVMLALTAGWGRLLAPHGSIAVEMGDTYSGSGGAGGDYDADGLRAGQNGFKQARVDGWPLAKSLAMIPELYAASLAYGRNLLTGAESPAGRWRVRNFKPWIRSNPPVGALGDKERPATSYITVACRNVDRYFDLDAVRTAHTSGNHHLRYPQTAYVDSGKERHADRDDGGKITGPPLNPAGAPPLDWVHQVDALIDHVIDERAGKANKAGTSTGLNGGQKRAHGDTGGNLSDGGGSVGARGVHIRRALETAGYLITLDALDVSLKGYPGSHYAVWPKELVKLLLQEMCPRRVCTTCGRPSRRIVSAPTYEPSATYRGGSALAESERVADGVNQWVGPNGAKASVVRTTTTVGWSDCGHGTWRPARILDPFAGSGTTLAVATGMGYDADGIDIDERNADLAQDRVGMFLEVIERPRTETVA